LIIDDYNQFRTIKWEKKMNIEQDMPWLTKVYNQKRNVALNAADGTADAFPDLSEIRLSSTHMDQLFALFIPRDGEKIDLQQWAKNAKASFDEAEDFSVITGNDVEVKNKQTKKAVCDAIDVAISSFTTAAALSKASAIAEDAATAGPDAARVQGDNVSAIAEFLAIATVYVALATAEVSRLIDFIHDRESVVSRGAEDAESQALATAKASMKEAQAAVEVANASVVAIQKSTDPSVAFAQSNIAIDAYEKAHNAAGIISMSDHARMSLQDKRFLTQSGFFEPLYKDYKFATNSEHNFNTFKDQVKKAFKDDSHIILPRGLRTQTFKIYGKEIPETREQRTIGALLHWLAMANFPLLCDEEGIAAAVVALNANKTQEMTGSITTDSVTLLAQRLRTKYPDVYQFTLMLGLHARQNTPVPSEYDDKLRISSSVGWIKTQLMRFWLWLTELYRKATDFSHINHAFFFLKTFTSDSYDVYDMREYMDECVDPHISRLEDQSGFITYYQTEVNGLTQLQESEKNPVSDVEKDLLFEPINSFLENLITKGEMKHLGAFLLWHTKLLKTKKLDKYQRNQLLNNYAMILTQIAVKANEEDGQGNGKKLLASLLSGRSANGRALKLDEQGSGLCEADRKYVERKMTTILHSGEETKTKGPVFQKKQSIDPRKYVSGVMYRRDITVPKAGGVCYGVSHLMARTILKEAEKGVGERSTLSELLDKKFSRTKKKHADTTKADDQIVAFFQKQLKTSLFERLFQAFSSKPFDDFAEDFKRKHEDVDTALCPISYNFPGGGMHNVLFGKYSGKDNQTKWFVYDYNRQKKVFEGDSLDLLFTKLIDDRISNDNNYPLLKPEMIVQGQEHAFVAGAGAKEYLEKKRGWFDSFWSKVKGDNNVLSGDNYPTTWLHRYTQKLKTQKGKLTQVLSDAQSNVVNPEVSSADISEEGGPPAFLPVGGGRLPSHHRSPSQLRRK
jgi:hypothetical protein